MTVAARIHAARLDLANGLLQGTAWKGPLTYAIGTSAPSDPDYAPQRVDAPPRAFAAAVKDVFGQVARIVATDVGTTRGDAAVDLYVADSLAFRTSHGTAKLPLGGYAFFPGDDGRAGDVWIGSDVARHLDPGGYGYRTLMHEIGHALGLKHPDERGQFGPLAASLDSEEYSVMSARSVKGADVAHGLSTDPQGFSTGFGVYDIAALQHMYGADYSDHGNDRYSFDPLQRVISTTIWDGGGTDTYDFSLYMFGVEIDLSPGGVCRTGQEAHLNRSDPAADPVYADGAVHNAYLFKGNWRSAIENARGGWGDDAIHGNRINNVLDGGMGDDTLFGERLFDTLKGGDGDDDLYGGTGADHLIGGNGADLMLGHQGDDALFGGAGNDLVNGAQGNDVLDGGSEADRLMGGAGDDMMTGGSGADVFVLEVGTDVVTDFTPGVDHLDVLSPAAAFAALRQGPLGAVIDYGDEHLTLRGVAATDLTLADFI